MNNIKVKLLHHTPIEVALKALEKPYANYGKCNKELLKKVCLNDKLNERHGSVLEHINLTFEISGSSRLELQEHARHRIASPTVESTRYVLDKLFKEIQKVGLDNINPSDYLVVPDLSETDWDEKKKEYFMFSLIRRNKLEIEQLYYNYLYCYNKKKDNDVLKYLLPENFRVNFVWTINLRSLLNFFRLRLDKNAHMEIRYIASLMWEEMVKTGEFDWLEDGINELIGK
jgi:thymidylate synthase (FAD)